MRGVYFGVLFFWKMFAEVIILIIRLEKKMDCVHVEKIFLHPFYVDFSSIIIPQRRNSKYDRGELACQQDYAFAMLVKV